MTKYIFLTLLVLSTLLNGAQYYVYNEMEEPEQITSVVQMLDCSGDADWFAVVSNHRVLFWHSRQAKQQGIYSGLRNNTTQYLAPTKAHCRGESF